MLDRDTTAPPRDQSLAGRWAPGWYSDPQNGDALRYWDGDRWTEHTSGVHQAVKPQPDPVATAPAAPPARDGFFGWIGRHPKAAFWSTLGVALVVGIAVGAASGNDDSKTPVDQSSNAPQLSELRDQLTSVKSDLGDRDGELASTKAELANTRDKLRDARADVRNAKSDAAKANKKAAKAKKAAQAPAPSASSTGGSGKSFSGNGGKNLGTITVARDSVLKWTNDGDIFQMWDDDFGFNVNSQGHSGDTALSAGTYKNVTVNAIGNWTIQIVPR
jgi:hypothetical protein